MKENQISKWAFPVWSGGAVLFGLVVLYSLYRGDFKLYELGTFVLFAFMAFDKWRKRRRENQGEQG